MNKQKKLKWLFCCCCCCLTVQLPDYSVGSDWINCPFNCASHAVTGVRLLLFLFLFLLLLQFTKCSQCSVLGEMCAHWFGDNANGDGDGKSHEASCTRSILNSVLVLGQLQPSPLGHLAVAVEVVATANTRGPLFPFSFGGEPVLSDTSDLKG